MHDDMNKKFSLAYLTVTGCDPLEMIYIAARTGYDYVSLRMIPMGISGETAFLPEDEDKVEKVRAALKETGVGLLDIEVARIHDEVDPRSYVPALEKAAELGAGHVISSAWTSSRDDRNFVVDTYAHICDLAKPFGLKVSLEFPSFSRLTNLQETADIVQAAARPNGGILVDTLYMHFSRVAVEELEALPDEWFHFMHVCDGPAEIPAEREKMVHVVRDERLYFGEGCIDFPSILGRLPQVPLSIELPHAERVRTYGFEEHARRCLETAKKHLNQIDPRAAKTSYNSTASSTG